MASALQITDKHRLLLSRLADLIPDLDPDAPETVQRIFGLGLIALTMQVTNKARADDKQELVDELGALARAVVEEDGSW